MVAFRDIDPQAPVHVLVDHPRAPPRRAALAAADPAAAGRAGDGGRGGRRVAEGFDDYRLVFNTGAGAGQSVFHAHGHVLGRAAMTWPPG